MQYWLVKSEGDCYSIDDLRRDRKTAWTGVRNYQARNFMMKSMSVNDLVLFYHSNSTSKDAPNGVYGVAKVVSASHPDESQFSKEKEGSMSHFDPKATREKPIWYCVDIAFVERFAQPVTLDDIKLDPHLEGMELRARGSRLSVQPVSAKHFEYITFHAEKK